MWAVVDTTWEQEITFLKRAPDNPAMHRIAGLFGQFELNRTPRFLLHKNSTLFDAASLTHITDTQSHQITASELAVNGQVEKSQIAYLFLQLEPGPD
jgi:hypothetical protein